MKCDWWLDQWKHAHKKLYKLCSHLPIEKVYPTGHSFYHISRFYMRLGTQTMSIEKLWVCRQGIVRSFMEFSQSPNRAAKKANKWREEYLMVYTRGVWWNAAKPTRAKELELMEYGNARFNFFRVLKSRK